MKTRIVAAGFAMAAAIAAGPAAAQEAAVVADPTLEAEAGGIEVLGAIEVGLSTAEVALATTEVGLAAAEVANSNQELQLSQEEAEATTGPRGMSTLARTAESYIPLNWEQTLALMQESGGELGGLAEQIRKSASKLDESYFAGVDPKLKAELDREMRGAAAGVAMNATVYDASQTRQERLDEMADAIEEAEDAKAIWDLQARVSIENGMLLNELIRLQSMNAMVANQHRIDAQQTTQESFSLTDAKY